MTNNARSLDDIPVAYLMDDSWVWKDDMIVFPREDGFYDDENESDALIGLSWYNDGSADRILADLETEMDHPICGEFPHDSILAPRGFWND